MQSLHSKVLGEGRPMIILHGFLGMSDNWKTLGSQYAENGMEVHLIDQRNHGKSFHSEDFNYKILSEDIRNYIERHSLSEAIVLGHSMGGKTAMQLACSYPHLVNKLIVADIGPKQYPPHHQHIINALIELPINEISTRGQADTILSKKISDYGTRQFLLKNLYWVEKGKLGFRMNLPVLSAKMKEIGEALPNNTFYSKPTLFVKGGNSDYILLEDTPQIKKHFPLASIETIENVGHWLHAENPALFLEKTLNFINQ
ncbi:pimeloyl-ACP methyl ester carboxylesterase [Saonia flava]|uniref:Pimeloyl-ACP methyl ester carboxylesterase n=1 Tax=Saonia flava TaxID=523696 RepID=A0A846QUI6_9FLAO|nr:alpha/beta fold hydrolase [Saonia flava]NJB70877.1 pimeloyl-ACP methyl ester carboxylesterase [Saonia flava]